MCEISPALSDTFSLHGYDGGQSEARKVYKDHNLHVLFGVTLMAVLGVSSITPALPEIRDAFRRDERPGGALITVFTLPGVALTPVLGVLSDRHGRRRILVPALLLFGVAGGLCAFARTFELLLALLPWAPRT